MMSFTHNENEMRIYTVSIRNKLDGIASIWQHRSLIKVALISFDDAAENILHRILMYNGTSIKRTSSKADTSLRQTKNFVPDEFLRNP